MKRKKIIGIELDEIIRNKALNFDRYYYAEFGEDGIPEGNPYVYDFFESYRWDDVENEVKYLKDDLPEDMSITEYHRSDESGKVVADDFLFTTKIEKYTKRESYNKFLYQDYPFEIFGNSPMMYKNLSIDLDKLFKKYEKYEFVLISVENPLSIGHTLFFLSKNNIKFKNIKFLDDYNEVWKHVDIYLTSNPKLLQKNPPFFKRIIPVHRPYNNELVKGKDKIIQIDDLLKDNNILKK